MKMNYKLLRSGVFRIKRILLDSGFSPETAYLAFIYIIAEYYLCQQNLPYTPEQLVPEFVRPAFPENLYQQIRKILTEILPDKTYPVQAVSWMHQYYHADEKDRIFSDKNHKQIAESEIPVSTQFFPPEWLSEYMLSQTLGRIPEDLTAVRILDPCAGTGHILLTAFELLMQKYQTLEKSPEKAVRLILQNHLYGLELDPCARRIAEFVLLVKALQYDADFLTSGIRPQLYDFPPDEPEGSLAYASANPETDKILKQKFQIVVTNPPYMGNAGMPESLLHFVRTEYPDSFRDLYACFIERCSAFTEENGFCALLTVQNWMFLPAFSQLRKKILESHKILHLLHLGACAFDTADVGTIVQSVCFIMQKQKPLHSTGIYYDLCEFPDTEQKRSAFLHHQAKYYEISQDLFFHIPDSPLVYWASEQILKLFEMPKLESFAEPKQGLTTSDNPRFVRLWHEVEFENICFDAGNAQQAQESHKKWFPYHKGGGYRKWYGNHLHVLNYQENGRELLAFHEKLNQHHAGGRIKNKEYYFRPSLTWTFISKMPSFRKNPAGFLFDVAGSCLFVDSDREQNALLAFLCSNTARYLLYLLNPTMNLQPRNLKHLPYLHIDSDRIQELVQENIELSRQDWDSSELSWNFKKHPLLKNL